MSGNNVDLDKEDADILLRALCNWIGRERSVSGTGKSSQTAQAPGVSCEMRHDSANCIFEKYAHEDTHRGKRGIGLREFKEALCAARTAFRHMSEDEAKQLFAESDLENDGLLSEQEFTYALDKKFPVEQALSVLPIHRLLESSLPGFDSLHPDQHLETFINLSDQDVAGMVAEASPKIMKLLLEMVNGLKKAKLASEERQNHVDTAVGAKFDTSDTIQAGTIDDFHKGLEGRVGGDVRVYF